MNYMNGSEIDCATQRFSQHPILSKATAFLAAFKEEVDSHSDGWAYWKAPVAAANKLMEMIQGKTEATEANYKKAMAPIKSFYTRRGIAAGMQMPIF